MGGFIALNAMKRFPSRFEALILCDTQCIADSYDVKVNRYKTISDIKEFGPSNFNDGFIKNVFHESSIANKPELVEKLRKVVFSNSQHIITQGLIALAERAETCSILDDISIPTLIICGREDVVKSFVIIGEKLWPSDGYSPFADNQYQISSSCRRRPAVVDATLLSRLS